MTRTRFAEILTELSAPTAVTDNVRHEHSPFHLADLAGCYSPDSIDSPGAAFLSAVARDVADTIDADDPTGSVDNLREDGAHEIADSAVPIYTHERWQVFVDLGAYNEDASELGDADASDLTQLAGIALYMIAERLVRALADELAEALDEDTDDEEQDERPDGSMVYYTRDPSDGYYTAITGNGVQIGPGRFETIEDARAYLASLDDETADV